jgi:hypothetical protein
MDRNIPYRRRMARVEEVISEVRHHAKCTTSCSHIERMDVNLHTRYVWAPSGGELSASRSGRYMNRKGAVGGRHVPHCLSAWEESLKMIAFWNTAPCSLVEADRRFRWAERSASISTARMEEVRSAETSVYFNKTALYYIPEGYNFHTLLRENLKSYRESLSLLSWIPLKCGILSRDFELERCLSFTVTNPVFEICFLYWVYFRIVSSEYLTACNVEW